MGKLEEVKCVIPDRSYAGTYRAIIEDCQKNGQFDWKSTGHVSNVGLMAQKVEEYGSHDKTFEIPTAGTVIVTVQDWVKLAVSRGKATGSKVVFWLDPSRAHDA